MNTILRTKIVYEVNDSFESTRSKMRQVFNEYESGTMEEDGSFTYKINFMMSPVYSSLGGSTQIVYGKGKLEADGTKTLIRLTVGPNLVLVFFVLLIFPIINLLAIHENKRLNMAEQINVWNIVLFFLLFYTVFFSMVILSAYLLKRNFEKRFDLSGKRK